MGTWGSGGRRDTMLTALLVGPVCLLAGLALAAAVVLARLWWRTRHADAGAERGA